MTAIACMLAAVLMIEAAVAPATADRCPIADNRCQAEHYERRAGATANEQHRALYLFGASKSYLFVFDKTGDARDLCAARRAVDASLDVRDQPAELRAQAETFRATLVARVQQEHVQCGSVQRGKRAEAPLVARRPATAPEPPADLLPRPAATPAPPADLLPRLATAPDPPGAEVDLSPETAPSELQVADAEPPAPSHDAVLLPVSPSRTPRERPANTRRPGRGLVLAGGVTLGVGVALTAVAGVMGRRMLDTRQQLFALGESVDGFATPQQAARDDALRRDFRATMPGTVALAVGGGMTVVVAVILASVGGRRMARSASRTALLPAPGGLAFHARF